MPRQIRDPRSRQQIVEAAWRLVVQRGLGATTMRAIAAEAGVTTGSVTHYFEDKAEVLTAALRYNNNGVRVRVADAVRGRRGLAAVERAMLAILPLDADRTGTWRVWLAFWAEEMAYDPDSGGLTSGYLEWRSSLRAHLAEAVTDGELPEGLDLRYEADRLSTLLAGLGLLAGTEVGRGRLRGRVRRMLTDHLAGLGAGSASIG